MRNFCFDVKYATRLEKTIDENINKVQQSYKQYSECLGAKCCTKNHLVPFK